MEYKISLNNLLTQNITERKYEKLDVNGRTVSENVSCDELNWIGFGIRIILNVGSSS